MAVEFRDRTVALAAGQMCVVPRGAEHRPVAPRERGIMRVEPRGVVNTGDAGGACTGSNDAWVSHTAGLCRLFRSRFKHDRLAPLRACPPCSTDAVPA